MQLSQIPLGLQMPLVAGSLGASRFWLYQAMSPLLRSRAPLATIDDLTLGARTRISLLRGLADKQFPNDWNLEFSLAEPEPQGFIEASVSTQVNTSALQPVSEAMETLSMEPSPTESASTELPQPLSAKPHNHRANLFKQQKSKQEKSQPTKLASTQIERLQPHDDTQLGEQTENCQLITEILDQDEQWEQPQSDYSQQFYTVDELEQQTENAVQLRSEVHPGVHPELYRAEKSIEFAAQTFNPNRSKIKQTKKPAQQKLETNLIEQKSKQRKQKNKQNAEVKKGSKSRLKKNLKAAEKLPPESQSSTASEHLLGVVETDFISNQLQELSRDVVNDDVEIESDVLSNLTQPDQSEQIKQDELLAKPKSLAETIVQASGDATSVDKIPVHTALIDQLNQSTLKTDQVETPIPTPPPQFGVSTPPQGFSIGGQVTDSRAPAKPIDASDTVPAMLTPGEFVVNAIDTQKHLPLLHHINRGGGLEVSDQVQAAKVPQITEHNSRQNRSGLSASSDQPLSPEFTIHHPPLFEVKSLQSGVFEEHEFNQSDNAYQSPDLIFRSQQPAISSSSTSSINSPTAWNSIEDLLQISTDDVTHSNLIGESVRDSHHHSDSSSNEFTASELISNVPLNLPQKSTLQPTTETVVQVNNSNAKSPNDPKTLEAAMEILAQEIYARLHQRLSIERERQGVYSGRLPW